MKKYAIGVDIGGSHISCAAIDLDNKSILQHTFASRQVDNKAGVEYILNNWILTINESCRAINRDELAGIGFAMPGPFEYDKGIARFNSSVDKYESLSGINIAERLMNIFSFSDASGIRFMNDASAFAVGEAWFGKASDVSRSVSVTLGTGFGSAFIEDGLPVVERNDVPEMGCVWHLPFNKGIGDDYFSTRWFIKNYKERTGKQMTGVREIADIAHKEPVAKELFMEYGSNLGNFLGPWLEKFNANTLVIGGNVSAAYSLFGAQFEKTLEDRKVDTSIYLSELKENAAIIGKNVTVYS